MSRGRGGKLGRTREIETFLLFPRGKVFMPSILFRPKHAHFSRFNKRNFNGRLPDKNTTNIFEQTRIFRFDFQIFLFLSGKIAKEKKISLKSTNLILIDNFKR